MTATYDDYRQALLRLRDLPANTASDLEQAQTTRAKAIALADQAVTSADAFAATARTAIEAQLAAASSALEALGKSNLVPPQMRPSGGVAGATRDDVTRARQALAAAVNDLRQVAQAEAQRIEADRIRLAREAAELERLARQAAEQAALAAERNSRTKRMAAVGALIILILILILIFI